jgi:hypothetical protein
MDDQQRRNHAALPLSFRQDCLPIGRNRASASKPTVTI